MKKMIFFIVAIRLSLYAPIILAQSSCKVLMPEISGEYTGSCKNGLAQGVGKAIGLDRYMGEFKKGLPQGVGTYIWHTGETYTGEWNKGLMDGKGTYVIKLVDRDSTLSGIWRDGKYMGEKELAPYVLEYRSNIGRVSFMKVGDRPYVKYVFSRNGGETNNINNLLLLGSSGTESTNKGFTGYEQVTFPFKGKVTYSAPNAFMATILYCELRIVINEPGSWIVTMFY